MTAGHKHSFRVNVDGLTAYCACGRLHFGSLFLAMLFLDFHKGQPLDGFLLCLLGLTLVLSLHLGHSSDDFEHSIVVERLVEILHEIVRAEILVLGSHP